MKDGLSISGKKGWKKTQDEVEAVTDALTSQWQQLIPGPPPPEPADEQDQTVEQPELTRAKKAIQIAIDDTDNLLDVLAEVCGKTSSKSKAPPPTRDVQTEDPQDDSQVVLCGSSDAEDEEMLAEPLYRAKVLMATLFLGVENTDRCGNCLRLTKDKQRCTFCMETCCTRDCAKPDVTPITCMA